MATGETAVETAATEAPAVEVLAGVSACSGLPGLGFGRPGAERRSEAAMVWELCFCWTPQMPMPVASDASSRNLSHLQRRACGG